MSNGKLKYCIESVKHNVNSRCVELLKCVYNMDRNVGEMEAVNIETNPNGDS